MCGSSVPANFQLVSKTSTLTVKFHSDSSITKSGFRAVLVGKFLYRRYNFLSYSSNFLGLVPLGQEKLESYV